MMMSQEKSGDDRLVSGLLVGPLGLGGQFVLWAMRRQAGGRSDPLPDLAAGFRLAFGLARIEPALAAFLAWFELLRRHARAQVAVAPLRCACVTTGERALLELLAAAQAPRGARAAGLAARLVATGTVPAVVAASARFAEALSAGGLQVELAAAASAPQTRH